MPDFDIVRQLLDLGFAAVFLYLYLQERKRVKEVTEERINDLKEQIAHLTGWTYVERNMPVKTQQVDGKLEVLQKL